MVKVGDIFVETWGYDQTNATFYQVVKVGNNTVSIRQIKSKISQRDSSSMSGYAVPIKGDFESTTKIKKITNWDGEEAIRGDFGRLATKWDGEPVGVSWYG